MFKKIFSLFLGTALSLSPLSGLAAPESVSASLADTAQSPCAEQVDGRVLVTLATPKKTALTKEGDTFFDSKIRVEDAWDFGGAEILGDSDAERDFLEDKTMYVSCVSSDTYSTDELIDKLENQAYVVSVEPDYCQKKMAVSNDSLSDSQWYLDGKGIFSSGSEGIRYQKDSVNPADAPIIAVADTGVDYTHEDLKDHMWYNPYSSLPGVYGYDFGDGDSDPMDEDEDGHGTHCAGVIAASTDNSKGIAGISGARIMALKIFDSEGRISNSSIVAAFSYIYQAKLLGANITAVNCSWGGGSSPAALKTLIEQLGQMGVLFIFAAGNDGVSHDAASSLYQTCPYDIDSDYIVTVGASDLMDNPASYSDYGMASVDLFAPGTQIVSTVNQDSFSPALYPAGAGEALCSYYSSCPEDAAIPLCPPAEAGIKTNNVTYENISHSSEDYFNDETDGSVRLDIQVSRPGNSNVSLYLDVTKLGLSSSDSYYISYDIGLLENGAVSWEHLTRKRTNSHFVSYGGRTFLQFASLSGDFHSITRLYFDNLAVSTANPDTASFGRYAAMTGTSMAAPVVTGAVAVMASRFPSDTSAQRRERLLSCVRTLPGLALFCRTSGILDMSRIATSTVTPLTTPKKPQTTSNAKKVLVKKIKLNKKKATLRYKKKLKLTASVKPKNATNKKIKWSSSRKKYATVTQSGVVKAKKKGIGHTVKIYARAKDGSGTKTFCKVKIKRKKKKQA